MHLYLGWYSGGIYKTWRYDVLNTLPKLPWRLDTVQDFLCNQNTEKWFWNLEFWDVCQGCS